MKKQDSKDVISMGMLAKRAMGNVLSQPLCVRAAYSWTCDVLRHSWRRAEAL